MENREMPNGWREETLVDLLESLIDYRGKTPEKSETGIQVLSAKSVKMGYIDYSQVYYISEETYNKFMVRGFPRKGDILMTTEAPLGCIAKLDKDKITPAQRLLTLRGEKGVLYNDYLMYFLMSEKGQHELHSRASGTTVQGIKRSEFVNVKITIPSSYEEQKAIADVLSSLDEKIELLEEENKTLETLAQTIFTEWFVNFNFPGATGEMEESELGEIPKGWRVGKLSDFGKIICGKTPSKGNEKYFNGEIPFIKIPDLHNQVYIIETSDTLTEEGANSQKLKMIPKNSLVISCIATVGLIGITTKESQTNQQINSIIPTEKYFLEYLYFGIKKLRQYLNDIGSGGTATLNVNTTVFSNIDIIIPAKECMKLFSEIVNTKFHKIKANSEQIQTLKTTRDTLLPKLMSGEIRVEGFGG